MTETGPPWLRAAIRAISYAVWYSAESGEAEMKIHGEMLDALRELDEAIAKVRGPITRSQLHGIEDVMEAIRVILGVLPDPDPQP